MGRSGNVKSNQHVKPLRGVAISDDSAGSPVNRITSGAIFVQNARDVVVEIICGRRLCMCEALE